MSTPTRCLPQFYAPMPCMIWVACLVEIAIEDWTDFFILLSLQLINASVSLCAFMSPRRAARMHVSSLLLCRHRAERASLLSGGAVLTLRLCHLSTSSYEAARAGDAVAALKAALKPHATVKRDGHWTNINAAEVVPGVRPAPLTAHTLPLSSPALSPSPLRTLSPPPACDASPPPLPCILSLNKATSSSSARAPPCPPTAS